MSWIILPIAQEYEKAGDFEPKKKIIRSLKIYLIIAVIAIIGLILFIFYLVFVKKSFSM